MFKINDYFDGKVKSITFKTIKGTASTGVMAAGEYEFGTTTIEHLTVTSGEMTVLLPHNMKWKTYIPFETFVVDKNVKFKVKIKNDTSYICLYK